MSTVKYADINGLRRFKENLEAEIPTKTSDLTNDSNFTKIVEQASAPSNPSTGDLWIDTDEDGYNLTVDSTVSGSSHNPVQNQAITNYVNKLNTYSTTEQRIGTWIDGKPIYRKVISVGGLTLNTYDVDISSLNANMVFLNKSVLVNNTSTVLYQFPIYYTSTNDYFKAFRRKEGNNDVVRINIGSTHAVSTNMIRLIIEYTKTTD